MMSKENDFAWIPFPRGSNEEKWNWLESIILIDAQCVEHHQGFYTHLKLKVTSVNHFAWCPLSKRTKWLCKRNEMKLRSTKDSDFIWCTDYGARRINENFEENRKWKWYKMKLDQNWSCRNLSTAFGDLVCIRWPVQLKSMHNRSRYKRSAKSTSNH